MAPPWCLIALCLTAAATRGTPLTVDYADGEHDMLAVASERVARPVSYAYRTRAEPPAPSTTEAPEAPPRIRGRARTTQHHAVDQQLQPRPFTQQRINRRPASYSYSAPAEPPAAASEDLPATEEPRARTRGRPKYVPPPESRYKTSAAEEEVEEEEEERPPRVRHAASAPQPKLSARYAAHAQPIQTYETREPRRYAQRYEEVEAIPGPAPVARQRYVSHVEGDDDPSALGSSVAVVPAPAHFKDQKSSATGHHEGGGHKHHGGDKHHEKGGGKKHHAEHHEEEGHKGDKGYKGHHEYEKGEKGHHDKEGHAGHYKDHGGKKEEHHEGGGHFGEHHHGEKGEKGAKYGEGGEHKKGHSTKGEHNIHKKDEYEKKHEFFDEYHEGGEHSKHGEYGEEHEHHEGGHKKGGHHHGGHEEEHHGKKGHHHKGHHHHEHKGHKGEDGHEEHHGHHEEYDKKGGHDEGKKWGYSKGDGKKHR